jgi:hypothetical protein
MTRAGTDDVWRERVEDARRDLAVVAAVKALVPAGDAGAPAWGEVVARAAALPACTCRETRPTTTQETAWPLPIRRRRTS